MSDENYVCVKKALDVSKRGLERIIEKEYINKYNDKALDKAKSHFIHPPNVGNFLSFDISALLHIIIASWKEVFNEIPNQSTRTLLFELRDIRNKWAHAPNEKIFSDDDTSRVLDTVERLLTSISAKEADEAIILKEEFSLKRNREHHDRAIDWDSYCHKIFKRLNDIGSFFIDQKCSYFESLESPDRLQKEDSRNRPKRIEIDIEGILKLSDNIAIIGDSGSGKTFYLKQIAHYAAEYYLSKKDNVLSHKIPIITNFSHYDQKLGDFRDYICASLTELGVSISKRDIFHSKQRFIICIDGFEDMPSGYWSAFKEEISNILPEKQFIISIKPDNHGCFNKFKQFELNPFTDDMINILIDKHQTENPSIDFSEVRSRVIDFASQHPRHRLPNVLINAIEYYRNNDDTLYSETELYRYVIKEQIKKQLNNIDLDITQTYDGLFEMLRELAWKFEFIELKEYYTEGQLDNFIDINNKKNGLITNYAIKKIIESLPFLFTERGKTYFSHELFQKTLAADKLMSRLDDISIDDLYNDFRKIDLFIIGLPLRNNIPERLRSAIESRSSLYLLTQIIGQDYECELKDTAQNIFLNILKSDNTADRIADIRMLNSIRNSKEGFLKLLDLMDDEEKKLRVLYKKELEQLSRDNRGSSDHMPIEELFNAGYEFNLDKREFNIYFEVARSLDPLEFDNIDPNIIDAAANIDKYGVSARCYAAQIFGHIRDFDKDDEYLTYIERVFNPENEKSIWVRGAAWWPFFERFNDLEENQDKMSSENIEWFIKIRKDQWKNPTCLDETFFPLHRNIFNSIENDLLIKSNTEYDCILSNAAVLILSMKNVSAPLFPFLTDALESIIRFAVDSSEKNIGLVRDAIESLRALNANESIPTIDYNRTQGIGRFNLLGILFPAVTRILSLIMLILIRTNEANPIEAFKYLIGYFNEKAGLVRLLIGLIGVELLNDKYSKETREENKNSEYKRTETSNILLRNNIESMINMIFIMAFISEYSNQSPFAMDDLYLQEYPKPHIFQNIINSFIKEKSAREAFYNLLMVYRPNDQEYRRVLLNILEESFFDNKIKNEFIDKIHRLEILPDKDLINLLTEYKNPISERCRRPGLWPPSP